MIMLKRGVDAGDGDDAGVDGDDRDDRNLVLWKSYYSDEVSRGGKAGWRECEQKFSIHGYQ